MKNIFIMVLKGTNVNSRASGYNILAYNAFIEHMQISYNSHISGIIYTL